MGSQPVRPFGPDAPAFRTHVRHVQPRQSAAEQGWARATCSPTARVHCTCVHPARAPKSPKSGVKVAIYRVKVAFSPARALHACNFGCTRACTCGSDDCTCPPLPPSQSVYERELHKGNAARSTRSTFAIDRSSSPSFRLSFLLSEITGSALAPPGRPRRTPARGRRRSGMLGSPAGCAGSLVGRSLLGARAACCRRPRAPT